MGAMTPATAMLYSGLIGGAGSLGAGLLSSSSASSNNAKALDFNRWSQLQAQEFQRTMYNQQKMDQENFYTKYQSPEAIAKQLQKLGLNPANVLGQGQGLGGSPVSMPSGMSSPALSAPALENEGTSMAQAIQAIGSSMASIAQAGQTSEQSQEYLNTFNERVNALILKNNEQELLNAKAQWDLYAAQEKLPYQIQEMVLNAYKLKYEGEYTQSLKALTDIQKYIEEHSKDFTIEQRNMMSTLLGKQVLLATEDANLRKEQQKTERTQQELNVANKNESVSRRTGIEFENSIKRIDSENAAATAQQKLAALREEYMKNAALSLRERTAADIEFEKLDKILKMYREHPNKAALDAALDNFNEEFPLIGGFIRAFK